MLRDNTVIVQPGMVEYDVASECMVKLVSGIGARGAGAEEVVCIWAIRIEIHCEVIPQKVHYLDFDGGVGFGGVNWWEGIPEMHNSVVVEVFS